MRGHWGPGAVGQSPRGADFMRNAGLSGPQLAPWTLPALLPRHNEGRPRRLAHGPCPFFFAVTRRGRPAAWLRGPCRPFFFAVTMRRGPDARPDVLEAENKPIARDRQQVPAIRRQGAAPHSVPCPQALHRCGLDPRPRVKHQHAP